MAVIEYRSIAIKVVVKDNEVHVVSAVPGGRTVRMIYEAAQAATVIAGFQEAVAKGETPFE